MTALFLASSMLLGVAAVPLASADDLKDRKEHVQGQVKKAERHLDQSSDRLVATTKALHAAEDRLRAAQSELAKARGELAAAEVVDHRMQAALDAAIAELQRSREDLADGKREVRDQETTLGRIAVQNYQLGGPTMLGLSMVLTSKDPAELSGQLNSVRNVLDKESVVLDRLKASKVLLVVQERKVEADKQVVAVRRQEAAENLQVKETLEAKATEAEDKVSGLVAAREKAQHAAAQARAEDAKQLRQLKQERAKISKMLKKRAIAARKKAAAAAARARARAARAGRAQAHHAPRSSDNFLSYPIHTYITSPYGMRLHPVYHRWTLHDGTDFGAGCGTPIRAAAPGTVIAKYYNTGYGNRVIIDHGWHGGAGIGTAYNHLSRYSTYVGQHVSRGEVIGYVGTTGYSTGCHLHFMVFRNGATVNPMNYL
ncbi:MAG TPA: peptidoglycan DD-metalloendopeptidase family protein [Nocardioidaceae bacterium]|nr:peptidoglycan DD-metalloendopeptidase family protein [Nocardioidaceae bacterium]